MRAEFVTTGARIACIALVSAGALVLAGCSLGRTKLGSTSYVAVPGRNNTNYFRVTVTGSSKLAVTHFKSGAFPADIVDTLYGNAGNSNLPEVYKLQEDIKKEINDALLKAWKSYLEKAIDPAATQEVLADRLATIRRVRAAPGDGIPLPKGAVEMEYAPERNLVLRGWGQKLVFVMSSDPNDVIGAISTFSNEVETGTTVLRLADLVQQKVVGDVVEIEARNEARDKLKDVLITEIDVVAKAVEGDVSRAELTKQVEYLRLMLENAR